MAEESYIIRGGAEGRARLRILTQAMAPFTNAFLDAAGIPHGASILDVGCGGGDVTRELARRTGPHGRALGTDIDAVKIAIAREDAQGIDNVQFDVADILASPIEVPFDVIYARFLLSHLTDPARALSRMISFLKPGGMLLVEEVDFAGHFCHPPRASFERYVDWYTQAARKRGADACLGSKLPALFREAGVSQIEAQVLVPAAFDGAIKQMAALTLSAIAENVIAEDLATRGEVEAALADLEEAAKDTAVFMSIPRIMQIRARKAD